MSKLALGTAQFGLDYGIANESGKIKILDAKNILEFARVSKIDLIDTAIGYGDSEKVIGEIGAQEFKIVSKLPPFTENLLDIDLWLKNNVQSSLKRLGVKFLYGLLLHRPGDLRGDMGKKLIKALKKIQSQGLIKKIGLSIYDPRELDEFINLIEPDIIQAPLNIIDRRLETSGWLSKLHQSGIEVHTRSTFLQGLLLIPIKKIPSKFDKWNSIWEKWNSELFKNNLNASEVCLSYPLSLPEVTRVIVGIDNLNQLKNLVKISKNNTVKKDWSFMISNDPMLIDPTKWGEY